MLKRSLCIMVVVLALLPAIARAQAGGNSLAVTLPADKTVFYAEIDVKSTLEEGRKILAFVDQEAGENLVFQVNNLYGLLRELCAGYEFQPTLFGNIADARIYLVVMAMDKPQVKIHKYEVPKYDMETGQQIPGEFEEGTHTERKNYVSSLVITAPNEETAVNFAEEFKALLDREKEKNPDSDDFARVDIEVERGELIGNADEEVTLGRLGEYLILSDGNPRELWAALMVPPHKALLETPVYQRLRTDAEKPQALMIVNIERLVRQAEDDMKRAIEDAEKKHAAEEGSGGEEEEGAEHWEVQMAKASYRAFLIFKELFSLGECEQAGACLYISASEDRVIRDFKGLFAHGENISPILEELLTGSGSFTLPRTGKPESTWIMGRVSLKMIYDEVLKVIAALEPAAAASFDVAMQSMIMTMGADLGEIFDLLASDFYVSIDIVEKEREVGKYEFDEESGEPTFVTEKKMMTLPEVTTLWGLSDPQAAGNTLSRIFAALAVNPQFSQFVKRRAYQETDVFCMGMDVTKPDKYPDGLTTFAATIVGRYFSFGSWEHVTALIRRMKSEEKEVDRELEAIVEKHADSNLIVVVPKGFQHKLEKLIAKAQGENKNVFDRLLEKLKPHEIELEDKELAERIKTGLEELILALKELDEKATAEMAETSVMSGTHEGMFYRLEAKSDMSK